MQSIIERIKRFKRIKSDSGVADILKIKRTAFAERKRRGSIPYEEIIRFCRIEGVSLDWMINGNGGKRPGVVIATVENRSGKSIRITPVNNMMLIEEIG